MQESDESATAFQVSKTSKNEALHKSTNRNPTKNIFSLSSCNSLHTTHTDTLLHTSLRMRNQSIINLLYVTLSGGKLARKLLATCTCTHNYLHDTVYCND